MKTKCMSIVFIALFFSIYANAKAESWYMHYSFGAASDVKYGEEYQLVVDSFGENYDETKFVSDLGLYFLSGKSVAWGFASHGVSHTFLDPITEESINLITGMFGVSFMMFTGSEPGSGLFLRLDAGTGVLMRKEEKITTSMFDTPKLKETQNGTGGMIALGFGVPVSEETRILVSGAYTYVDVRSGPVSFPSFQIGFLW